MLGGYSGNRQRHAGSNHGFPPMFEIEGIKVHQTDVSRIYSVFHMWRQHDSERQRTAADNYVSHCF